MEKATAGRGGTEFKRAPAMASWDQRCSTLFEDLRKPARVLIGRAYGSAFSPDEVDDVYANAWTSTLAALSGRARRMGDDELRSYLLTAVANHARKEMRRRSRKPTSALEEAQEQTLPDSHSPAPEERAAAAETGSATRDVLCSLPPRRRAVILLRYGWGLDPQEICALVDNLSPRAYRKEITRGVEEMIERLRQVESGAWCDSREPILREYVAGTASADARRQARRHIGHCRHCAELVARLQGHLHELGGAIAWSSLGGAFGERELALGERVLGLADRGRESVQHAVERVVDGGGQEAATGLAASGGVRGAGVAGAGGLAKLAGLGAAGKAALACLGASAAASVCVAAGVGPLAIVGAGAGGERSDGAERPAAERQGESLDAAVDPLAATPAAASEEAAESADDAGADASGKGDEEGRADQGADGQAPAAAAAVPGKVEFGLAAPSAAIASSGAGDSGAGGSGSDSGDSGAKEFAGP